MTSRTGASCFGNQTEVSVLYLLILVEDSLPRLVIFFSIWFSILLMLASKAVTCSYSLMNCLRNLISLRSQKRSLEVFVLGMKF